MKILNIRNAKWNEPDRRTFNCEAEFDHLGWVPFTYNPNDNEPHVVEFRQTWLADNSASIADISQSEYEQSQREQQSFAVRYRRNHLLQESDAHVLPDRWAVMTEPLRIQWSEYRQALRDVPTQAGFPFDVQWPAKP